MGANGMCRGLAQCAIVAVVVYYATGAGNLPTAPLRRPPGVAEGDCRRYEYNCSVNHTQIGLVGVMCFFPVLYFVVFCFYLRQAFVRLKHEPYADFKIGNLLVRLKVSLSMLFAVGWFPYRVLRVGAQAAYLRQVGCLCAFVLVVALFMCHHVLDRNKGIDLMHVPVLLACLLACSSDHVEEYAECACCDHCH